MTLSTTIEPHSDLSETAMQAAVLRYRMEQAVEGLLALLDALDGDPDLESTNDREPEETDCDLAGSHTDLERCDAEMGI